MELVDFLRDHALEGESPLEVHLRLVKEEAEIRKAAEVEAKRLKDLIADTADDAPAAALAPDEDLEVIDKVEAPGVLIVASKSADEFRFVERKSTGNWGGFLSANFAAETEGLVKDALRAMGPNFEHLPVWREGRDEDVDKGIPAEPASEFEVIVRVIR